MEIEISGCTKHPDGKLLFDVVFELRLAPRAFGREAAEFAASHDLSQGLATVRANLGRLICNFMNSFNVLLVWTVCHVSSLESI